MSTMTSFARKMFGGIDMQQRPRGAEQTRYLASFFKIDEYMKHRTHQKDFQRWINMGQPETVITRHPNKRQQRITRRKKRKV